MNYLFLKDIIASPWQVEPQTLNSLYPFFKGLFSGLQLEKGNEPVNHVPYKLSASTRDILMWSTPEAPLPDEEHEEEPTREKVINVVPVRGLLLKNDQECGPRGTRTIGNRLLSADEDESVIGHIFIVESGGGQASAVPELTEAMQKCTKPIVVWIDGVACSAAYYISCYAREIIASRDMDRVGCIGTMIEWNGRKSKSAENSFGEVSVTIYADGSDEKNDEYETAINEFDFKLAKERFLNPFNDRFKTDVSTNRPQVLAEQLKGRTYFAQDVTGSLVDDIGDFSKAIDRVLALANFSTELPTHESNQNSINSKKMVKQFMHLNNVLNVSELESNDDGVFLNEEQLASVETSLEANQQLVVEAETANQERATAAASLATAQAEIATKQATIAAAYDPFNAIDPSVATAATPEAKAEAIRTLLAARPAAAPVLNLGTKDEIVTDPEVDWEAINNLEHNKLVDENS